MAEVKTPQHVTAGMLRERLAGFPDDAPLGYAIADSTDAMQAQALLSGCPIIWIQGANVPAHTVWCGEPVPLLFVGLAVFTPSGGAAPKPPGKVQLIKL